MAQRSILIAAGGLNDAHVVEFYNVVAEAELLIQSLFDKRHQLYLPEP